MTQTKVQLLDLNGLEAVLDADADTTITADTDDQIDIRIAGADDFQFTANTFTAQSGSTITTPTLGVGNTKDLGAGIHIKTADSGASANAAADELVIEQGSSGNGAGLSILSATDDTCNIFFGDSGDNDAGMIQYNHADNTVILKVNGNTNHGLRIDTSNNLSTNAETSVDTGVGGLCLQQGANDGNILTCKSSDVGHGVTGYAEADTFFQIKKLISASGGAVLRGWTEGEQAIQIFGAAETANTTKSTSGEGICAVTAYVRGSGGDSAAPVDPGSDANLFVVNQGGNAKFIVDTEGQLHSDGGAQSAYDTYEDAQLVRAFDLSHGRGVIDSKFDKFISYNHEKLADMKLVGREEDGTPNHFINVTGMQRLHNGAIWQQYEKHQKLAEAVYEMAKEALGEDKADAILEKHDIKLLN